MARNPSLSGLDADEVAERLEAAPPAKAMSGKLVSYRVLKLGADKIFTGDFCRIEGHTKHPRGAIVHGIDETIALELEDRGWVEIGEYSAEEPAADA